MVAIIIFVVGLVGSVAGAMAVYLLVRKRLPQSSSTHTSAGTAKPAAADEPKSQEEKLESAENLALLKEHEALVETQKELKKKFDALESRGEELEKQENDLRQQRLSLEDNQQLLASKVLAAQTQLESIAGLSAEEAKQNLTEIIHEQAYEIAAQRLARTEKELSAEADKRGQQILAEAICRLANGFVAEGTVTVVRLPSDEMKGRIIGREGRNIRAFELATGVDIIVDDTPEVVVLSAFNPERRAVACLALERLIEDGRVHPARIEEVVQQAQEDTQKATMDLGEKAVLEVGVQTVHPEIVELIGRLNYRSSGGQNLWQHVVETALIAESIASELGLEAETVKRCALFHEIGRCIEHRIEGGHCKVSADVAKRCGEKPEVVDILREQGSEHPVTVSGMILKAADVLSRRRPGIRRAEVSKYVRRMQDLENIACAFAGVESAFAIQAGREVRVAVNPTQVSDQRALLLSAEISRKLEEELNYPGDIIVNVLRSARVTQWAK